MEPLSQTNLGGRAQAATEPGRWLVRLQAVSAWAGGILVVLILAGLAHAGFCAFTWRKFTMFDYGVYTNMIWNSGHGHLFRCLLDQSYLATHLSFTLALLGPLFFAWDHPFLPWTAQWFFLAGGVALLSRTAVRLRVPPPVVAAIAVFFVGYHYTQQAVLSEFHGVGLYLLLVPWLYHCLRFNRRWVGLPWLLILGVREDAALVVLPLLLYFAVRERWRAGYVYAALSVGYMVLALTQLFPLFAGMPLFERRHGHLGNPLGRLLDPETLRLRLTSLFWVVLPALLFARKKGWIPLLLFPSLALVEALDGGSLYQCALALHYSVPIMACLAVALVEAAARGADDRRHNPAHGLLSPWLVAIGLALVTAASYRMLGFLPGSRQRHVPELGCYVAPHGAGLRTLQAALHVPREGVLLCPAHMAGFCANRKDVVDWSRYDPQRHRADLLFSEMKYIDDRRMGFREWLEDGTFGLVFFDGANVVLKRGADPGWNHLVLEAYRRAGSGSQFPRSLLPNAGGRSMGAMSIPALHWAGSLQGETLEMAAVSANLLDAGDYEAVFLFSASAPKDGGLDAWGTLQVRRAGETQPIAAKEIEPVGCGPRVLRTQRVAFALDASSRVETAVVGRRAELWLLRADFVRRGEPWEL